MSNPAPAEPPGDANYVDPEAEAPRRSWSEHAQPVLAGLAVVALLAIIVVVFTRPIGGTAMPPTITPAPVAITPEAPWDGRQSRRLPVAVQPATGISDSQTVTITGTGFPAGKSVAAVVCTIAAGSQGVDACDISTSSFMAGSTTIVDRSGHFTIRYEVHRHIVVGAAPIDCGTGNVDPDAYHRAVVQYGPLVRITTPGAFSCVIAVGAIDNYDQSGGALVAFTGEVFRPFEVDGTPETSTVPSSSPSSSVSTSISTSTSTSTQTVLPATGR